jgi:hypothetical protein
MHAALNHIILPLIHLLLGLFVSCVQGAVREPEELMHAYGEYE